MSDIEIFYDLLAHKNQTEIRAFELSSNFKVSKCKGHFFVSSKEKFVKKVNEFEGKYNIYAGLNERNNKGTEAKDVISVKRIFLDIDCKTKPASEKDMIDASAVCNAIVSDLKREFKASPTIINSGNGYQLVYCIPKIDIEKKNREEVQEKIQLFTKRLIEKYSNDKVKLDSVGDLPRIIRITGTTNIKGGRISKFVEICKKESLELKENILNLKFDTKTYSKVQGKINDIELKKRFEKVYEKDERIKKLYDGNFEGYNLSVGGELALVCFLIQSDFNREEIFNIMASSKIGRWSEKNISYRKETYNKALKKIIKERKINPRDFLTSKGINSKTGQEEFSVNIDEVADYLILKHNFVTWFGKKSDYSFNWNGKIFDRNTRGIVKVECEELLKSYCKRNIVEEIFEKVKRKSKVDKDNFEKTDIDFIPFENGIWDINKKKLLPHDPKYKFQFIIPQTYNKEAKCPLWLNFINETLYPEDVKVMQEWFGFNLHREYFIKKAGICVGGQDTGKSVLLDTLITFIGEKNKTGLSLQKISSGSDFTKLSLKDKHSNIYDDLSSKDLSDGGAFKVATGGGWISGEEKFGEYHQFRSFAKQLFATNKIPPVKDNDDMAYFGRYLVFKFDNVPEKIDPFLRKKLWTDEEMSGILSWALEGLYRLLKNGNFSYNKSSQEIKEIMEISGCPLVAFSSDVLEREDGNIITKEEMFKIYSLWCEKTKRPRLSKEMLGRQLTKYCSYILPERQKERIWKNAKLNEKWKKIMVENNLHRDTDTSDTLFKFLRYEKEGSNKEGIDMGDIKSKKASEVTTKKEEMNDTNDTISEKEKEQKEGINFGDSGI